MASKSKAKPKTKGKKKPEKKKGFLSGLFSAFGGSKKKKTPAKGAKKDSKTRTRKPAAEVQEAAGAENWQEQQGQWDPSQQAQWDQSQQGQWDQSQQWDPNAAQQWDQSQQGQWDPNQQGQWDPNQQWDPSAAQQWDQGQQQPAAQESLASQFGDFDFTAGGGYSANYHEAVASYGTPAEVQAAPAPQLAAPVATAAPAAAPKAAPAAGNLLFPEGVDTSLDSLFDSFETTGTAPAAAAAPAPAAPPPPPLPSAPPASHPDTMAMGDDILATMDAIVAQASTSPPPPVAPDLSMALNQAFSGIGLTPDPAPQAMAEPQFSEPAFGDMAFEPPAMGEFGDLSFDQAPAFAPDLAFPAAGAVAAPPPPPQAPAAPPPPVPAPPGGRPGQEPRQDGLVSIGKMLVDQNTLKRILDKGEGRTSGGLQTRIISATKGQDIDQLLAQITQVNGVSGAIIVGRDGLVISSTLPSQFDKEMMGAIASSMYSNLDVQCKKMQIGSLNWGMLETAEGLLMLVGMDAGVLGVLGQGLDSLDLTGVWLAISETAERV